MLPPRLFFRPPPEIIRVLRAEHDKIRTYFLAYLLARKPQHKQRIGLRTLGVLERHTRLEETVFFPAFAAVTDAEGRAQMRRSLEEHQACAPLMQALRASAPDDPAFHAQFRVLIDTMQHNMDEEEQAVFPRAAEALMAHDAALQRAMQAFRHRSPGS